ncbi:protein BIG GRAIN 1-like A [Gossypium hirsutum]|uniref:Protein BIG GRAIN 1-like A n=1 Tax=Gossypium hirsutum TaxID=3635 RepID=A0ABM3AFN4_GOSHI|nr:protein BIG GRAIN 1-like A [Gossypium hirsutum]
MFRVEKTLMREERYRHKRDNPSFSSSLLDQICRSIDDNDGISNAKNQGLKFNSKKQEIWDPQRDCLIEKWMENKVSEKKIAGKKQGLKDFKRKSHHHHHHVSLFSSSSSSSDSSSGGFFSSSDTESLYGSKTKAPCFVPPPSLPKPKPVRTSVSAPPEKLDERSKSRAMKIYGNLKKVKQPISPGARLASFINSLFTNSKKTKNPDDDDGDGDDEYDERKLKSSQVCSSASSSRSCLSKNTREKSRNGVKRTVRFCPVSVIVDEDSRPCGQKGVYEQQESRLLPVSVPTAWKIGKSSSEVKFQVMEKSSESSSDLFELDHLVLMGNDRYKEELPVYETTHVETNRAIANGFKM